MSLTFTKSTSSSLSNSNRVNSFKSKNKGDFASKKAVTVSKSQFNPQCPVVILKRPCSDSKASINIICVDSENKSIINTSQSFSNKLNTLETKRKSAPKSQTSKSPNLSSSVNISKTKSSPKGKLALGAQPLSEARSSNKTRPHFRGKPRRNSVSAHNVSNFNSGLEDQVYSPGSLSDDPFNSVSPSAPLNSIKESSMYNPEYYTVLFNQDKKNQEALSLLESLLSKSLFDLSLTDKLKGPHDLSSTHENKKKAMASHLLINLLKPSPGSPNMSNNQGPKRFYAGPQFKQAPNISSLPFPATMINRA